MTTAPTTSDFGSAAVGGMPDTREAEKTIAHFWWLYLVTGVAWVIVSLSIAQFDQASVKTVGIIVGCMFMFAAAQQIVIAALTDRLKWLWGLFGLVFFAAGIICFINPENTFAALADILGFLFLSVGVWWTIRSFLEREAGVGLWWLTLVAGILMVVLAFETSGQFFIEKAYTLLVFAGIWALMHGITDIARAFMVRSLRNQV